MANTRKTVEYKSLKHITQQRLFFYVYQDSQRLYYLTQRCDYVTKRCNNSGIQSILTNSRDLRLDDRVLVHHDSFKTNPTHNTDNKGHLICHIFLRDIPAPKTDL
jgi:hypothetical protein